MCFSATASFGAGAAVAAAGIVSVKRITNARQIMFAVIPLIFALQQIMEGWVWITFAHEEYRMSRNIPVTVFLFFAQVAWPVWVPLAILKIEPKARLRAALKILCFCSFIVAPLQAFRLFFHSPDVSITGHHIHYQLDAIDSPMGVILNVFYFLTTIVPPFVSSRRSVLLLASFNLLALMITWLASRPNVVSLWCFFAALISVQIVRVMGDMKLEQRLEE
ncbi:DUF6629 family protein [Chryseolinea sp. T2]|uniref:DUF6629 family protein n=1 Tax=Chryseolinea sp. T2 TaxID=3129255 RepID=UPI003077C5DF